MNLTEQQALLIIARHEWPDMEWALACNDVVNALIEYWWTVGEITEEMREQT